MIASGIKVHCSYFEIVDVSSLKPNPRNPNQHPDIQVQLLSEILIYQGWRVPITVSNRSGLIVKGHCRLLAAEYLELKQVPVDYQDYDDDIKELSDLLADNQLPELAHMNTDKLKEIILKLDAELADISVLGMSQEKLDNLIMEQSDAVGSVWDGQDPGKIDEYMPFKFGVISGMVSKKVYDRFVEYAESIRANYGTIDVPLAEIVSRWMDEQD